MTTRSYKVAGHVFTLETDLDIGEGLENYAPFAVPDGESEQAVFTLKIIRKIPQDGGPQVEFTEETRQDEEGQQIICGHTASGQSVFEFRLTKKLSGTLVCEDGYRDATVYLSDFAPKYCINNALMVLYALATAPLGTALFHSAVVSHGGYGYMFLGKSGTGKSTHARLWLKHIENTTLLNDDNPVVRVLPDGIRVYGSPWSGKTPCYKNEDCPLGGIVLLEQAPHNKIRTLRGIEGYAAILTSISGKRWDKKIADGLHETENAIAMGSRIYHLECLPDGDAARLCHETIKAC